RLVVQDLTRSFGARRVFGPLSFEVTSGSVLGVAGANGSGKTTLLKTLAGLIRPTRGSTKIFLEGKSAERAYDPRDRGRRVGGVGWGGLGGARGGGKRGILRRGGGRRGRRPASWRAARPRGPSRHFTFEETPRVSFDGSTSKGQARLRHAPRARSALPRRAVL